MDTIDITSFAGLSAAVMACVAWIRSKIPAIDGAWAAAVVFIVSMCVSVLAAIYVGDTTAEEFARALARGVIVAVLSLGGDSYLVRIAGKVGA